MEIDYAKLVKGNILAKKWAKQILGRRKLGKFLSALFDPKRAESLRINQTQLSEILSIPAGDRETILATRDLTHRVFEQFDKLAIKLANRYAVGVGRDNPADVSQIESEARVGLLKAIRGYSDLKVKFLTYAYRSIQNEVSRYIQKSSVILSGLSASILVQYKRKQEELANAYLPHSFEDVCLEMALSQKKAKRLRLALQAQATGESELETSLASVLLDNRKDEKVDAELIRALEAVALSQLEKYAWISQNENTRGLFPEACRNLKDVALRFQVSPQAASDALRRARKKLATGLGRDWRPD